MLIATLAFTPASGSAAPSLGSLVIEGAATEGEGLSAQQQSQLANPEAARAREEAETAYAGLSSSEARALADRVFGSLVNQPENGLPQLPQGEKITGYVGPHAARLSLPDGRPAVLESFGQIAQQDASGGWQPVDLALQQDGAGYGPKRAPVNASLPADLSEGVSIPSIGVSLTPLASGGQGAAHAASGVLDGYAMFWGDSSMGADVDMLGRLTSTGADLVVILRSQASPQELSFTVGMPHGAKLVQKGALGDVQVVDGGVVIARILTPAAKDAEGTPVPVSMSVSGDVVTVSVPHAPGQYKMPIAVDPEVADSRLGNNPTTNWRYINNPAEVGQHFWAFGEGTGWVIYNDGTKEVGDWGALLFPTQGQSEIYAFNSTTFAADTGSGVKNSLVIASGETWQAWTEMPESYASTERQVCLPGCVPGSVAKWGNTAFYKQSAQTTGVGGENKMTAATVFLYQATGPSVSFDTTHATINGRRNVLFASSPGWLGPNAVASGSEPADPGIIGLNATDPGVGVSEWGRSSANGAEWLRKESLTSSPHCADTVECEESFSENFGFSNHELADGEDTVEIKAANAMGMTASATTKVKVDGTAPYNVTLTGLPASNEIGDAQNALKLKASATDGTSPTISSGIASLTLFIDGTQAGAPSGSCTPGPCTASAEWTINAENYASGKHTFTVKALDNAGNSARYEVTVTVHHAGSTNVGPGELNPISGQYTLHSTDVSVGGLSVSRVYNSRRLTAGSTGPMGPQWSMALAGQASLVKEANGSMTLTSSGGAQTTFTRTIDGKYQPPRGDGNLSLVEKTVNGSVQFVLSNTASTSSVTFAIPSGGTGYVWMPIVTQGKVATETTTYSYETAEVPTGSGKKITRAVEALAPVPSGVSCSPTLKAGCRALTFNYATSTTATGEAPAEWGDVEGDLTRVYFTAYDPVAKAMKTVEVAHYLYDKAGRMRTEWDPRISPALKVQYGYDSEGHVTSLTPPGRETWAFTYGTISADSAAGRLLKVLQAPAATPLWSGELLKNTEAPALNGPTLWLKRITVSNGTWTGSPIAYGYAWSRCNTSGGECKPIAGATNVNYYPSAVDVGHTLVATVTAINGGGAVSVSTPASGVVTTAATVEYSSGGVNAPVGIAPGSDGNLWINKGTATGNEFGKLTTGGALTEYAGLTETEPQWIASGPDGNLWFTANKAGFGKLTTAGVATKYSTEANVCPQGITGGPDGYIWFTEACAAKIVKATPTGAIAGTYSLPAGSEPWRIASGPDEAFWFTDTGTSKIGRVNLAGAVTEYSLPAGSKPYGIALGPDGNLWFTDYGTSKVGKITTAGAISEWALPAGSNPYGIAKGSDGALWFTESGTSKIGRITTTGTITEYVQPSGSKPEGIVAGPENDLWFVDNGTNKMVRLDPNVAEAKFISPQPGTTIEYRVPVSGTGAPQQLGATEVEAWGQKDDPSEATAVFPPDEVQGWPAKDYVRATVDYFDNADRVVNVATPSGAVSTTEYNETNDVVRSLSADNRAAAVKEGAKSAETAALLDTQSTYNSEGTELLSTLGPRHTVKLAGGREVQARSHTVYSYDENAPSEGGPYRLVTKVTQGAQVEGEAEQDIRTTVTAYSGQNNLGWILRKPTSVTTDPSGLKLVHTTIYDPNTGNVVETRTPGAGPASEHNASGYVSEWGTFGLAPLTPNKPASVATDASGNLWVADTGANRIQEISASNEYVRSFGTEGTGNGQLKKPQGIAVDSTGHVWVLDSGNNRVEEFSSTGEYMTQISLTTVGPEALKNLQAIYVDGESNVWVTGQVETTLGQYVEEITSAGVYVRRFGGTPGSGNGQFAPTPAGLAMDSEKHVWVADTGNNRVEEFSSTGTYMAQFGVAGSGNGQLSSPDGIATDSANNIWVADANNNRIQEFTSAGAFMHAYGAEGTGNGLFKKPHDLAVIGTRVWVADTENSRLQALTTSGAYSTQYPAASNVGKLNKPHANATDAEGNVWVADTENNRVEEYSSTGTFIRQFSGTLSKPKGIAIDPENNVWVTDNGKNLVQEFSSTGTQIAQYGSSGELAFYFKSLTGIAVTATTPRKVYVSDQSSNYIVSFYTGGAGSFAGLVGSSGAGNGQLKEPQGLAFDSSGNLWVADAGNNRIQEFSYSGAYVAQYGTLGTGNGQFNHPEGLDFDTEGNVWVADTGNWRAQQLTATGVYKQQIGTKTSGPEQLVEPGGLTLDSSNHIFVLDTGKSRVEKWVAPSTLHESFGTGGTHGWQTIYYTSEGNSKAGSCGFHPEWTNLVCQTQPAAQPNTAGVPNLPVTTYTYNMYGEAEKVTSTVGTDTRTTASTYDESGRIRSRALSSTVGTAMPTVNYEYSAETGVQTSMSTTVEEKTQTLTSVFNRLGQLTSYTDGAGNTSTYEYEAEKDGRLLKVNDGQGTQTYTYDATTGLVTKLVDSAAGTFTATYDVEGNMTSEGLPNAMSANYTLNPAGSLVGLQYVKNAHCAGTCPETWYSDSVAPSIHGQWLSQASTYANKAYTYDNDSRLTQVQDTPTGKGCITRIYSYDEETNRVSATTRPANAEGKCATEGGTVETHTYDPANRLLDTGTAYDSFGDTTKLPAVDAGGTEMTNGFYADSQTSTQTQNGQTVGYQLDPAGRISETVSTGKIVATEVDHYAGPEGAPSWVGEPSAQWTHYIHGISGSLAAIQHNAETPLLQLVNLHGDVVATAYDNEAATALASNVTEASEYGVPATEAPAKYSWLGAHQTPTVLPSGAQSMGARTYVPQLGRFLQTDPVPGGSANAYAYTYGDPVNSSDPTGAFTVGTPTWIYGVISAGIAEREGEQRAAEEAEARAEAERKAAEAAEQAGLEWEGSAEEEWSEEEEGEEEWGTEWASASGAFGPSVGDSVGNAVFSGQSSEVAPLCTVKHKEEPETSGCLRPIKGKKGFWHRVVLVVAGVTAIGVGAAIAAWCAKKMLYEPMAAAHCVISQGGVIVGGAVLVGQAIGGGGGRHPGP